MGVEARSVHCQGLLSLAQMHALLQLLCLFSLRTADCATCVMVCICTAHLRVTFNHVMREA